MGRADHQGTGDGRDTFDEFYAASYRRLVGQIYGMCGNLAEAQDCVQEAFVRAWDKRRTLDVDQFPRPGSVPSPTASQSAAGAGRDAPSSRPTGRTPHRPRPALM